MKKILLSAALFGTVAACPATAYAPAGRDTHETQNATRAPQADRDYSKLAKKEAKALKKEGWTVTPGSLTLEMQLERYYSMADEKDEDGNPLYLMVPKLTTGASYDAARMQAIALAKQELAGLIATEVSAEADNRVANGQIEAGEAASLVQTVTAGKASIAQSLGRIQIVFECYRTLPNRNKEVSVRIAYSGKLIKAAANKLVRDNMERIGEELHNDLERKR